MDGMEKTKMSKWKFFTESEVEGLNDELVQKLEQAREKAGIPFVITSGYRSPTANQSIGGSVSDSAHLSGLAVDLRCSEVHQRFLMVKALLDAGFTRLGIYDRHVHSDIDKTKDSEVIWIGTSH